MNEAVKEAVEMMEKHLAEVAQIEKDAERCGHDYEADAELADDYDRAVLDWECSDAWGILEEDASELWEKYDPLFTAYTEKAEKYRKEIESFDYEEEARCQAGDAKYRAWRDDQ